MSITPILLVMRTVGTVIQYHSTATLELVTMIMIVCVGFEMLLTWGRKLLQVIMAAKLDASPGGAPMVYKAHLASQPALAAA